MAHRASLLEQAQTWRCWSEEHYHYLHQHPELSLKEHGTSAYCQGVLGQLGYTVTSLWETGFIADMQLGFAKTIAFRADMDALPIQEDHAHAVTSKHPGVAHMCGHDVHMTIALTAAKLLMEHKDQLKVNVRFVFQPSEEMLPGGALGMIQHGCLDGVDEIYGLHNDPETPVGVVQCLKGAMTASCDKFKIHMHGKGGHSSAPHTALDPVHVAASLVGEINHIIPRFLNPMHPAVVSVTNIHAGTMEAQNVIPEEAILAGTVRSFDAEDRAKILDLIQKMAESKEALGYQVTVLLTRSYPSVMNQEYGQQRVLEAAQKVLGEEKVLATGHPKGWGEDYAYYLQHIPGAFFILGSAGQDQAAPLHSPHFIADPAAIAYGAAIFAELALQEAL